jgi:hypothetical protein
MTQVLSTDGQTRPEAAGFLLGYADGTVLLLARQTGAVLATGHLDRLVPIGPGGLAEPEDSAQINLVGGRLMVVRGIGTPVSTVTAYDLPGMTQRWSLSGQLPVYPDVCGMNLCLSGNTSTVVAVDPAAGTTVWRAPGWESVQDLGGGRLLGYRAGGTQAAGVLDAGTGRRISDLGAWTPLGGTDSHLVSAPDVGNYRYTRFGVLEPERGRVLPLGRLEGLSTGACQPHGDLLVCRTLDTRLKVWRYHE